MAPYPKFSTDDYLSHDDPLFDMYQTQERPQRRHRAAYLAPSAGRWPQHQSLQEHDEEHIIPLLVEVPTNGGTVVESPPSSGELMGDTLDFSPPPTPPPRRGKFLSAIIHLYHAIVDILLVVVVCILGTFFYDVEVSVVKSNRRRNRQRGRSGRVLIRQGSERIQTSLLRTPPRTPDSTRAQTWGFV